MVQIGDKVSFNGTDFYEVTHIVEEEIPTRKKGTIKFRKLYFGDLHRPMYEHSTVSVEQFHAGSVASS